MGSCEINGDELKNSLAECHRLLQVSYCVYEDANLEDGAEEVGRDAVFVVR